jgi:alkylmercury lyase
MTLKPPMDAGDLVRSAAFRLLATRAEPIAPATLAEVTGITPERLAVVLDGLEAAGRIRRDKDGHVVGSAGLSVVPDRHEIELEGRRFWTWCAYDILGIFGALSASGRALTPSPTDGQPIEVAFLRGRPQRDDLVLFRPDANLEDGFENVYADWCPNSNLFATRELADGWAKQHETVGQVLDLSAASKLATGDWEKLAEGVVLTAGGSLKLSRKRRHDAKNDQS